MGGNGKLDRFIAIILFVAVVGTPHGVPLLGGFVVLQRAESRLIKITKHII